MIQNVSGHRSRIGNYCSRLCLCSLVLFLCVSVIIYIRERFEEQRFVKSACRVQTSHIESIVCRRKPHHICYFPIWEVEYDGNWSGNATIIENFDDRRTRYSIAYQRKKQFRVSRRIDVDSFPVKTSRLDWFKLSMLV